ncbi:MAG TPA: FixH family protein [Casimicrobiaceae bacterium]|nr:FixH family protein [Casimicrobiaceae bacterium]
MRNPASSSRVDALRAAPWYRQPWPWLFAGPAAVVLASAVSAWLAVKSDDGVVASDYYKRGLLINKTLPAQPLVSPDIVATLQFDASGAVRARIEGVANAPERLDLTVKGADANAAAERVTLLREDDGEYVGALPVSRHARWIVTLQSRDWSLPTTVVAGALSQVRLETIPSPR